MTDPFSTAREAFVKMDDVNGRLLLITVSDSGERESNLPNSKDGDMYTYIVTDTVVLDGEITEMIDEVPMILEDFQFSGEALTGQLMGPLKKLRNGTGNGMVLGRLSTKPTKYGKNSRAWVLTDPSEADKVIARKYYAEMEAKKAATKPKDPFAAAISA